MAATASSRAERVWSRKGGGTRIVPKKSASIHLERRLAASTQTIPKWSAPTCWTREWNAPLGLWTVAGRRARERLLLRVLDMGLPPEKEGEIPRFSSKVVCIFFSS